MEGEWGVRDMSSLKVGAGDGRVSEWGVTSDEVRLETGKAPQKTEEVRREDGSSLGFGRTGDGWRVVSWPLAGVKVEVEVGDGGGCLVVV